MGSRPKFSYVRSDGYRRFVARQGCFSCGIEGYSQAAHPNQAKYGKGRSIKASDAYCFPLCGPHGSHPGCHAQLDLLIDMTKDEQMAFEDQYVERMITLAARNGWLNGRKT